jgi:hypothetical protein
MGAAARMTGIPSHVAEGMRAAAERHVGDDSVPGVVALVARGDDVRIEGGTELDGVRVPDEDPV